MPNSTVKFGLRPVRMVDGSPLNFQTKRVFIAAADATAVFLGDLVKYATMVTTNNPKNLPTVAQSAASDTSCAGVVVGFDPIDGVAVGSENLNRLYRPASTAMYALICADERVVFEIKADNGGAALSGADVMENADIVVSAGDTSTGLSGMELDSSTHNTTATLPLRILGFSERVGNAPAANDTVAEVILNTVATRSSTGLAL